MPIEMAHDAPTILLRKEAFDRAGLTRSSVDQWLGLTSHEFRVEADLIAIGPLYGHVVAELTDRLEEVGLVHYEDFFDLSGAWPPWLRLFAMGGRGGGGRGEGRGVQGKGNDAAEC